MNRKSVETDNLLTRIQQQLMGKGDARDSNHQRIQKPQQQLKKKTYGSILSSAQVKSQSSEKPAHKSESLENLFSKKADQTLSKKPAATTQQQEKLHQSFSHQHPQAELHSEQKNATKSMYFTEFQADNEPRKRNPRLNDYFSKYTELLNRCSKKDPQAEQADAKAHSHKPTQLASDFESFKIEDINSLIDLIDNCVQEANYFIRDLAGKVELLQEECDELKKITRKLEEQSRSQLAALKEKDEIIERLNAERNRKPPSKNEQLKHLLKMIETLNQENNELRMELDQLRQKHLANDESEKKGKEIFNEIHRKIDLFNITVSEKPLRTQEDRRSEQSTKLQSETEPAERDSLNTTNGRLGEGNRKYKFIKPKG